MSQDNIERATRVLNAASEFDTAHLIELTDPDVEWQSFFALGRESIYRGHREMRKYTDDLREAWDALWARVEGGVEVDDLVLLVGSLHGRGKGSGIETETRAGWVFMFRNGRVLRFRAFREPKKILEATLGQDAHADS